MRYLHLAAFLALAGCAVSNAKPDFSMEQAAAHGEGLLVGSFTIDSPDTIFSVDANLYYQVAALGGKGITAHITVNSACDDHKPGSSDFTDACGRLIAVKLPAGEYMFNNWELHPGGPNVFPEEWQPVKFTIVAGKATYIGNIHMALEAGMAPIGSVVGDGWPKVADRRERDLPLLLQRYPQLQQSDVAINVVIFPPPGATCHVAGALGPLPTTLCTD